MTTKKDIPADAAPDGIALTEGELKAARKEGAKEDAKEAAKDVHRALTDGVNLGEAPDNRFHGWDEIQSYAHYLDMGADDFSKAIGDKDSAVPDEKVYGLLALERNGQNRTPYVKAAMKRLKLKADELPGGGPGYTNDVTAITDL